MEVEELKDITFVFSCNLPSVCVLAFGVNSFETVKHRVT